MPSDQLKAAPAHHGSQRRGGVFHWEDSMKRIVLGSALAALMFGAIAAQAQTPSWVPPADSERCPSKWGTGDERGAANHMKPATVLNALKARKDRGGD
jgi:hypothetical protein